ncbi:SDR family NAD(P)-dependent oxidoreductase [Streptomyces chiangmaiensis]|uniref:SDR family oxidoreductase n=1 Tax=Streptomyces chiangmaiensis TaxID=766497 RepID=A0ABU7FLE5_9ACTN|nr:SDR family oxidoreductase [Streptomyces chiangmaiensis]MED7824946.1 SDR family oxidoreductase [Streptomyces chiangmaiensis]
MDLGLKDRVYIVTGGTRGLGLAAARELTSGGAKVVVSGRSTHSLAAAEAELGGPAQAVGVVADNADPATPDRLIASAREAFRGLDGALISVGGPPTGTTDAVDDEQWRASFESGFLGAVRLSRAVAAQLGEGGVIGFVLSTSVYEPIPGLAVSNALRPALAGYAKTLAGELGPRGVRVVGLVPAHIATDRALELQSITGDADRTAAGIPLRRLGTLGEFGRIAAFLLSPAASYVTGAMVTIDGGTRTSF